MSPWLIVVTFAIGVILALLSRSNQATRDPGFWVIILGIVLLAVWFGLRIIGW